MNLRWLMGVALAFAAAGTAGAQVSVYADFSAVKLTGGLAIVTTNILYGPTVGVQGELVSRKHVKLYADIRGGFYGGTQRLDGVAVGPKIALTHGKYEAYGELMVGFARYNNGLNLPASSSTDAELLVNVGLDRQVTKRFDWRVVDYSYEQYYGIGGEFNPKVFSTGLVFHLGAR